MAISILTTRKPTGAALAPVEAQRLRALLGQLGVRGVAADAGASEPAIIRASAGMNCLPGTLALVRAYLARVPASGGAP